LIDDRGYIVIALARFIAPYLWHKRKIRLMLQQHARGELPKICNYFHGFAPYA